MFYALFLLFMYDELKISIELATIILSIGAVGFVIGAVAAPALLKRLGLAGSLSLALLLNGVWRLVIPSVTYGSTLILLSTFWLLSNIGVPVYNINQVSFRQAIISNELQGRMNATIRTFGYGAYAVGALIGGVLGSVYGIVPTMIGGAIIALIAVPIVHFGPLGKLTDTRRTGL
jgi:predicted MFS family arabinose efflux permease